MNTNAMVSVPADQMKPIYDGLHEDDFVDERPFVEDVVEAMLMGIHTVVGITGLESFELSLKNSSGFYVVNVQSDVLIKTVPQLPCPVKVHRRGFEMEAQDCNHGKITCVRPYDAVIHGNAAYLLSPFGVGDAAEDALKQLQQWLGALETSPLKRVVNQVLLEREVRHQLLRMPASRAHHHAFPGGLLVHSMEALHSARQLAHCAQLETQERELCEVAALLHDLGKINTIYSDVVGLDHKVETLKLVERPLNWLIAKHPDLGRGLETILLQLAYPTKGFPAFLGTQIVTLADRFSTACDRNKRLSDLQITAIASANS